MDAIQRLIEFLTKAIQFVYVVQPWEQGVRVRAGKFVVLQGPGLHFIIPFVDQVFVQNTRTRIMHTNVQTISTKDGKPLTLAGSIRYQIADVLKLYQTLHQAESTIKQEVQALIAHYVITNDMVDCGPLEIEKYVNANVDLTKYGIADGVVFFITDCVHVRTIRLVQDSMAQWAEQGDLNTQRSRSTSP